MRILFSLSYYVPYVSGLTIHTQRLAEHLAKRHHDITVLTSQHEKVLAQNEVVNGVSVIRSPFLCMISKGLLMPWYPAQALTAVWNADVVIVNLPQFEGFIVSILARLLGKRLFCIYHCEVSLPKGGMNFIAEKLLHFSNFLSLALADRVVTYTEDYGGASNIFRIFHRKAVYIYPPILVPKVDKQLQRKLKKRIGKKKKYYIGVAARLSADKGIEFLLQGTPILRKSLGENFVILVAGPRNPVGEDKYRRTVEEHLKKWNADVLFFDTLPSEKMGSFYSLLDVLVLPSINSTEAFGMVQVEAMLCGVPVVASNLPGVRIPIKLTGMGELAKAKDAQDFASKIIQVLKHKERYLKKREFIEKKFSFKNTIAQYEELFARFHNVPISK